MVRSHLSATSWRLLSLSTTWRRACLGKSVIFLWLKTHARLQLVMQLYLPHQRDSYHNCRTDWIPTYPQPQVVCVSKNGSHFNPTLEQDPACTITHQTESGPLVTEKSCFKIIYDPQELINSKLANLQHLLSCPTLKTKLRQPLDPTLLTKPWKQKVEYFMDLRCVMIILYELTFWSFYLICDTAFGKNVYLKYIALGKANKKLKKWTR
jgi:hypothetical protein